MRTSSIGLLAACIAAGALAIPANALAQHAAKAHANDRETDAADPPATTAQPATSQASAAQVAADPVTGQLRAPTREEIRSLVDAVAAATDQSDAGLAARTLPDGTTMIDLEGRFESVSIATVGDGKVRAACVGSAGEARAFLEPQAQPHADSPKAPRRAQPATPALEEK